MTGDVTNLASRLEELAEAPAPPSNLDVGRARQQGRRRLYTRRATLFAGLAAAAGTATLVTPPVLRSIIAPEPAPATPPPPEGSPMITYATFGWLPESINRVDFGKGAHGDYTHAVNENAELGTHLWLSVYPAGDPPMPPAFKDREAFTADAPAVNGRTAHWVTENRSDVLNGGDAYLVWQAADGRWAMLHGYYLSVFDDPQAVLHRVASESTVAERAMPLPVRIGDLPAELRIDEVTFYRPMPKDMGVGAWLLQLFYSRSGPAFAILVHPEGSRTVTKEPGTETRKAAEGVEVCVTGGVSTDHATIERLGGPAAVLDRFTPLGLDESTWETN